MHQQKYKKYSLTDVGGFTFLQSAEIADASINNLHNHKVQIKFSFVGCRVMTKSIYIKKNIYIHLYKSKN